MSERRARAGLVMRSFLHTPTGPVSLVLILALILLAIIGPSIFGEAATNVDLGQASEGPSAAHPLGTDALGQDILARTLAATRLSLILPVAAIGLAALAGSLIGALISMAGPRLRRIGAGFVDAALGFGGVLLAVFIIAVVGIGTVGAVIAVAAAFAPAFARFTYSLVSSVNSREYVVAARLVGVSQTGILRRHIFPNIADSLAIASFTALADGLITLAALSFLGLGVQAPGYDWGTMLTPGVKSFYVTPWAALAPAAMVALAGAAFALFGDAIARAVNPLLWVERPSVLAAFGTRLSSDKARPEMGDHKT